VLLPDESLAADAWAIGPGGLLLRTAPPERLATALQAMADGLIVLDPRFPPDQLRRSASSASSTDLTPREREVLQLVAEGLSNRAIALRLSISEHTVKFHINAIMEKLGAQSRTEAVVRATRLGLIVL
jgi:DNA-binding NarL/FixJ family response regulator